MFKEVDQNRMLCWWLAYLAEKVIMSRAVNVAGGTECKRC